MSWRALILAFTISWRGLFIGVEQTAYWNRPFKQPGLTASFVGLVGVGNIGFRAVYLQPLQKGGYGPAVQLGASVRIF